VNLLVGWAVGVGIFGAQAQGVRANLPNALQLVVGTGEAAAPALRVSVEQDIYALDLHRAGHVAQD